MQNEISGGRTDVGDGGSDTDFDAGVSLLSQLALEELVQLGIEDTVGDELAALRNSSLDSSHDCVSVLLNWRRNGRGRRLGVCRARAKWAAAVKSVLREPALVGSFCL
ncbi:hypothetical protein M747DRAFT_91685 [Aspergillus niger ATCC 13496]|uniref:Uncharacterized protein n=1 Tax=Aspergillus niger ATCC 13496 TaxID=1353008 RepID=A0A370CC79_ASPNG|nr:hypothetical protein M747DRAFT_91685 [Aspergillus niger ATCC 13496]